MVRLAHNSPDLDPGGEYYTDLFEVASTEHGIYSIGRMDNVFGLLLKYDNEDGKLIWRRRFTVNEITHPFTLAVSDAGVFVGGQSSLSGWPDGFVRLFSHDGDTVWTKHDSRHMHEVWDMVADATGVYVVGNKSGIDQKAIVRHLSNNGAVLWTRVMSPTSGGAYFIELSDGRLFVPALDNEIKIVRANDGAWLGSFPIATTGYVQDMSYHDGFLYVIDYLTLFKYGLEGEEIWRHDLFRDIPGPLDLSNVVASEDGIFVTTPVHSGPAVVRVGLDGTILDIAEYPGDTSRPTDIARHDGVLYVTGGIGNYSSYTARYSDEDLIRPSLLSLAGATPAMPPRLAVLRHDLGAGPVRVSIRDAAPGSLEYVTEFSEGLTPVGFDQVADLNGNGYEELVVVSRLPAVAELRDSLDGSLVATIKLGSHLEPRLATVEQRDGTLPRLAVVARNRDNDNLLLRIYNLENGSLLASNFYHPGFDPVDVAALPDPNDSGARRYALLARIGWPVNRTRSNCAPATAISSKTSGLAATGTRCS